MSTDSTTTMTPAPSRLWRLARIGSCYLTFGVVGALLLPPRRRARLASAATSCAHCQRRQRRRRVAFGLYLTLCLGLVVVRLSLFVNPIGACQTPASVAGAEAAAFSTVPAVSIGGVVRTVADSVPTGAGFAYSRALGAEACKFEPQGLYIAQIVRGYTGRGAFDLGQFVLSQPRGPLSPETVLHLEAHEAAHARQWSLFTIVAGPLAFPVSYMLDETFFPGRYNHFERNAGLHEGRYSLPEHGPPPHSVLMLPALALVSAAFAVRGPLQRTFRRARHGSDGCPRCGRELSSPDSPRSVPLVPLAAPQRAGSKQLVRA